MLFTYDYDKNSSFGIVKAPSLLPTFLALRLASVGTYLLI